MDIIFSIGASFSLMLWGITGILLMASYLVYQQIAIARKAGDSYHAIFRKQSAFIIILLVLWLLFFGYLRMQTALRPKNMLHSHNPALKENMQDVKVSAPLHLPPAQGDLTDQRNQGYSDNNTRENQQAIDNFTSQN